MPFKNMKKNCGSGGSNKINSRVGNLPNHHEDHKAGKEDTLTAAVFQAMNVPAAKAAVDKEENFGVEPDVRNRWSMKHGRRAQKFILHH